MVESNDQLNRPSLATINSAQPIKPKETLGHLTNKQQQLLRALEAIRIEVFIVPHIGVGRPPEDRTLMARAFIAKAI